MASFVINILALTLTLWSNPLMAMTFNLFHNTQPLSYPESHTKCQSLGYDGLAVLSTPEAYNQAVRLTESYRTGGSAGSINVGMYRVGKTTEMRWKDGTIFTQDTPYKSNFGTSRASGCIAPLGYFLTVKGSSRRTSICGDYRSRVAQGKTYDGQGTSSVRGENLTESSVKSYLQCVALCGKDHRCRAAEFHKAGKYCVIYGFGDYTSFNVDTERKTFVRVGFNYTKPN